MISNNFMFKNKNMSEEMKSIKNDILNAIKPDEHVEGDISFRIVGYNDGVDFTRNEQEDTEEYVKDGKSVV